MYCPECGVKNEETSNFYINCGFKVKHTILDHQNNESTLEKPKMIQTISSSDTVAQLLKESEEYSDQNHDEQAFKACEQTIKLDPHNADFWGGERVALYSLERCEEALETYDKAIEINPEYLNDKGIKKIRIEIRTKFSRYGIPHGCQLH